MQASRIIICDGKTYQIACSETGLYYWREVGHVEETPWKGPFGWESHAVARALGMPFPSN